MKDAWLAARSCSRKGKRAAALSTYDGVSLDWDRPKSKASCPPNSTGRAPCLVHAGDCTRLRAFPAMDSEPEKRVQFTA